MTLRRRTERLLLLVQLTGTVAILAWVPGNATKLAALLLVWAVTFRRIDRGEALLFLITGALFAVMNMGALRQGVFRFGHPDFLGMPVWEFFMWGFYLLHCVRMLGIEPAPGRLPLAALLATVFAAPFSLVSNAEVLFVCALAAVLVGLACFHERADLLYTAYMAALGAVVEYTGVASGQWSYPDPPLGGVPPWSLPMWAGIGLFTHRLMVPLLLRLRRGAPLHHP